MMTHKGTKTARIETYNIKDGFCVDVVTEKDKSASAWFYKPGYSLKVELFSLSLKYHSWTHVREEIEESANDEELIENYWNALELLRLL